MLKHLTAITLPFVGQLIALALVAMRATDHYIPNVITAAARKWNDVINVIAFTDFIATPITLAMLSFVQFSHIFLTETPTRLKFSRSSYVTSDAILFFHQIRMLTSITSAVFPERLRVLILSAFNSGLVFFGMRSLPLSGIGAALFSVFLLPLSLMIRMILTISFGIISALLSVFMMVLRVVMHFALPTRSAQISIRTAKVLDCVGKIALAFSAALERVGDINHDNLLKLSLVLGGPELGNSVVRRFIRPSQAHNHYTTERMEICRI